MTVSIDRTIYESMTESEITQRCPDDNAPWLGVPSTMEKEHAIDKIVELIYRSLIAADDHSSTL